MHWYKQLLTINEAKVKKIILDVIPYILFRSTVNKSAINPFPMVYVNCTSK